MRIVFSFDDGRADAYDAYKILDSYHFCGSFHIATGFIDGSFITDAFGNNRKSLSREEIKEMFDNGMDISSHGDKHITDEKDFLVSFSKISDYCEHKFDKIGFSVPNSQYNDEELKRFIDNNVYKLSYVRVGRSNKCYTLFSKISYVMYHLFHLQCFYNYFNKHNLIYKFDKYHINSLVVKNDTRIKHLIKFIDNNKNDDCVLVLMLHSIVDKPVDEWEYSKADFIKLCDYISNNIKCVTLESLAKE